MNLENKTALVTGGASGLGGAATRLIARAGGRVVVADINEKKGREIEAEFDGRVKFVKTDVTREADVKAAVETAADAFGGLHINVNCAGVAFSQRTITREGPQPLERFKICIEVNLIGTFNVIRLAADRMAQNEPDANGGRGVIVNTASVAAFDGQIGQAAYSASKGGIVAMTLPIARDLSGLGIRVCAIAPGIFDTPMLAMLPEESRRSLGGQVPFPKRLGLPEEFAALARHIIENDYLNGETIRLDGAIRMAPK